MDDKDLLSLLFSAIQHHNDSLLEDLLGGENAGTNLLDMPGSDGHTLLHVAVRENDLSCLICLLKHGADPNVFDATSARSPLHLAVELGLTDIVKIFLQLQHVNLELRDDRNLTCYEIAQFCDNQALADLILSRKLETEKFKDEFYTVMNQACTNNQPRLVRELFERYERKLINNLPKGWHPYKDKRVYSRSMLKELINWSSSSWNDVTLLFKSASKGHTEVCRLLIDFGATAKCNENTNYSPLYVAAYGGYTSTVRLFLDSFPSLVQEVTIEKWTVLHACCLQGHWDTAKLILRYQYPEGLSRRFVSRSGLYEYDFAFNLNAQDAAGQTVIYLAVSANDESLLDTLLEFKIEAKLIGDITNQLTQPNDNQFQQAKRSNNSQLVEGIEQQPQRARIIPDRPRLKNNTDTERTSRFNPSNHVDKIMRQLRKLQFSKETETTDNSEPICVKNDDNKYLICPFEMDTYCDYNSKTALHLAVCQQYHNIATTLLVNGSNPNLPILFRDSIKGDSSGSSGSSGIGSVIGSSSLSGDIGLNWLRSSKSTCLKEACRLNDERMCEILIRYGARDNPDNLALQVAAMNKNTSLISMFLSLKSNIDPEYKINRKCNVEFASRYKQCQKLSKSAQGNATTTFSSMFPSAPVTIDWQNLKCIQKLDPQWLIDASLAHNKRLRHPTNSLTAITRLDLSSNNLKSVHPVIFRLPSLRELNLSSNRLESLLDINIQRKISHDREPNTPTSKLIESQRTAMKRSKSSSFTNTGASLENSNVIDLNEPQEWDLPYLEVLDLHDNLLISLPDCLFELPKLSELDVSSNQLRQLPWAMWTAPSLKELIATSNLLDDLPKAPPQSKQNQNFPSTLETISDTHSEGDKAHLSNESFDKFDQSASFLNSFESITSKNPAYFRVLKEAKSDIREVSVVSSSVPLIHLNHWSKRIDLTSDPSNSRTKTNTNSQDSSNESENSIALSKLTYLNLSQNSFATIPPVLACIATELTRLNLSYNRLESLGDISLYPVDLKNLDLSNNQLKSWFQFNQLDDDTKHCYTINLTRTSCSSSFKKQRGHANLYCIHKLHQRLDSLKSFNLSHNQLKDIQIFQATPATQLSLINKTASIATTRETHSASPSARGLALLYPNVTALDVSYNKIQRVPETLSELKDLSVLNLNGNTSIATLPAELGLANKLWNLGVNGCNLSEPLKSIVESKTYKTMDIIGYLKSILEEAKQYARMKLMLVGLQGIGKTSLLEQMRQEGSTSYRRRAPEHWTKRMGHTSRSNLKNQKGVTLSTVGVDIHDWIYQKRTPRNQHSFGPVSFSTWDFGGQEEFYATHRYFLSRRSMYLVVWRLTDGINGILGIQQWLVNIQSRAPSSPVIIVGTHEDMIEGGERSELVHKLQSEVHRRFIDVSDHDKCGLPRIMDSIVVSTKTKLNIKNLCNRIYDVVFSLRCPGSTERLLEQKIPATYLYLEEIVTNIVHERHQKKREPVLTYDEYKRLTSEQLKCKYNKTFRDLEPLNTREINYNSELQQATRFLHENGVLLHYEDSNLRDLYFLDPQWLCDILSHVVTIREINPHVKNGLMKIDDLGHLFKSMDINLSGGVQSYVVNLLNKFEVALTWNSQYLLIPSLLPTSPDSLSEQYSDFQVKLAPRMRGRSVVRRHELNRVAALRSTSIDPIRKGATGKQRLLQANSLKNFYEFEYKAESIISRLVLLRYLPAGFLARLQSGILSDPAFDDACEDLQLDIIQNVLSETDDEASEFANLIGGRPSWLCWKKGIRLSLQKESTINTRNDLDLLSPNLMTIQEISPSARELMLNQINFKIECTQIDSHDDDDDAESAFNNCAATKWIDFDISQYSNIISVSVPNPQLKVTNKEDRSLVKYINLDHLIIAKLLSKAVDYIDDLLEDWYPSLGARFAHTLGGNYLVTRIVPCQNCSTIVSLHRALGYSSSVALQSSRSSRASLNSDRVSRMTQDKRGIKFSISSIRDGDSINNQRQQLTIADTSEQKEIIYCYYVEHCILFAYDLTPLSGRRQSKISNINLNQQQQQQQPQRNLKKTSSRLRNLHCPKHGSISVSNVAPDIVFDDVPSTLKIDNEQLERCKLIGRGALGFVFKGSLHNASQFSLQHANQNEVALKLLQPVDPGPEADQADLIAYNSAKTNWNREPFQCACKSYCSARHEVNILQTISHANIVSFIGLCLKPLAIVLELAPLGSLADVLKNYKRACIHIDQYTVQKSILQVAKALEFLHQHRVIYRDLKTENILVWSFPSPFATQHQAALVELKLADYGISRQALSTGIWKGFAGTMSYLAPEILRHNGDEEYTEKVDCFSFGMFLYELLTLRPPYKFNEGAYGGGGGGGCGGGPVAGPIRSQFSDGSGGGRPTLSKRDLIYPNYMLDLMSLCWSQEPHDRPTASQIVSIASTPEFMQIHDAVILDTGDKLSFCCAINHGQDVNLWFGSRVTQVNQVSQINVLATRQDQWVGLESIELSQQERSSLLSTNLITAMCLVDNKLWLCDLRGVIHVTSARPRVIACDKSAKLGTAPIAKELSFDTSVVSSMANCDDNGDDNEDDSADVMEVQSFQLVDHRNKAANLHEVKSLVYIEHAYSVVFLTRDGLLWTCNLATMICDQLGDSSIRYNCIALPKQNQAVVDDDQSLNRPTAMQNSNIDPELHLLPLEPVAGPTIRLYCGQTNGISSLEICESEIRRQSILPLNCGASNDSDEPQLLADAVLNETDSYNETLSEGSEIGHIVVCSSENNEDLLWTAANCTVHLWNIKEKRVIRKLECWKLVPCSESLESINIEQYYQQTKTSQVTSMVYMSDQLFVGTSHGCFIVIEASNLKPMTVFRPYESHVTILRPIRYAPNRNSINRNDQQQQQQQNALDEQAHYLVALGFGYRDLMKRYLTSGSLEIDIASTTNESRSTLPNGGGEPKLVAILLAPASQYNL